MGYHLLRVQRALLMDTFHFKFREIFVSFLSVSKIIRFVSNGNGRKGERCVNINLLFTLKKTIESTYFWHFGIHFGFIIISIFWSLEYVLHLSFISVCFSFRLFLSFYIKLRKMYFTCISNNKRKCMQFFNVKFE